MLERMVLWKITRSLQRSRSIGSRRKSQRHVTLPDDLLLRSGTGRLVPHRVSQDRQEARHGKSSIWFKTLDIFALDVIGEAIRRMPDTKLIEYYKSVIKAPSDRVVKNLS